MLVWNIALWVPFGFKERVELVVFDIYDGLIARLVLLDQPGDSAHGLARLSWHAH